MVARLGSFPHLRPYYRRYYEASVAYLYSCQVFVRYQRVISSSLSLRSLHILFLYSLRYFSTNSPDLAIIIDPLQIRLSLSATDIIPRSLADLSAGKGDWRLRSWNQITSSRRYWKHCRTKAPSLLGRDVRIADPQVL